MPRKCCVEYCENSEWKNYCNGEARITFHVFPSAEKLKSIWITQIKSGNNQSHVNDRGVVCSVHFNPMDFIITAKKTLLRSSAVPVHFPILGIETVECHTNLIIKEEYVQVDDRVIKEPKEPDIESVIIKEEYVPEADIQNVIMEEYVQMDDIESVIIKVEAAQPDDTIRKKEHAKENDVLPSSGVGTNIEFIDVSSTMRLFPKTIRYPGDIDVSTDMCPVTARQNILLCQSKIKTQAKEIYRLKQITERQRVKIKNLKRLLQENSIKPSRRSHASTSSNDSNFEHFNVTSSSQHSTTAQQETIDELNEL